MSIRILVLISVSAILGVATVFFLAVPLMICGDYACEMCGDESIEKLKSPSGEFTAEWYVRDCGATTSFVTHVTLHRDSWLFGDSESLIFVAERRPDLKLAWKSESSLKIVCVECGSEDNPIFRQESRWKDVTISYEIAAEND